MALAYGKRSLCVGEPGSATWCLARYKAYTPITIASQATLQEVLSVNADNMSMTELSCAETTTAGCCTATDSRNWRLGGSVPPLCVSTYLYPSLQGP